ncbi:potassium channel family protein [Planctomonas sp. JC2975]|uniref:potassium channel family protein n=1 Tax=Planctomonas sp. JC2975 TaxID=2729626 RepID=UPI00147485F9|nr:potassium channel family protein [Planctomonas sp. JC2975]NNC13149.1 potassium channel family protein [Planctomonas sp. JC2975]
MRARSERLAARERAVARWERASSWPFLVLSVAFIVAYSIRCLDSDFEHHDPVIIWTILAFIWAVFLVDFIVRFSLSTHKWTFVRRNVLDLLGALLPVFRPFRALQELRRIRYFRSQTGAAVRARLVSNAAAFVVLWVYIIAVTEVLVERGAPGASILSFGDAVYWAVVTIATVGYGDIVPVTTLGRTLAVLLMLSGIVIVGVTTATVVSYINDAIHPRDNRHKAGAEGDAADSEGE